MAWDWGSGASAGLQGASTGAMIGSAFGPVGTVLGGLYGGLGGLVYGGITGGQEAEQFEENKRRQEEMFQQQQTIAEANRAQARRLAQQQMNANMGATAQQYAKQQSGLRAGLASRGMLGSGAEAAAQGAFAGQRAQSLAAQQQAAQVQQAQADMIARSQAGMISANAEQARLQNEQAWNQRNQALFNNALQSVGGLGMMAMKSPQLAANLGGAGDIVSKAVNPYVQDTMKGLGVGAQQLGAYAQDTAKGLGVGAQQLGNMFQQPQSGQSSDLSWRQDPRKQFTAPMNPLEPAMEVEAQPFNISSPEVSTPRMSYDQMVTTNLDELLGGRQTSPAFREQMRLMPQSQFLQQYAKLKTRRGAGNQAVADRFDTAWRFFHPDDYMDSPQFGLGPVRNYEFTPPVSK